MVSRQSFVKGLEFMACTATIYAIYISTGVYHEKILKHEYANDRTQQKQHFNGPIVFTFFSQVCCVAIGWLLRQILKRTTDYQPINLPAKNSLICSLIININMLTYNKAIQAASFPAVVMVKSCSMLSVILVALFCSRVRDQSLQLSKSKLWVGLMVSMGIFLFNYFKSAQSNSNNNPISYLSSFLLLISLLGDGLLPDYQAEMKSLYKPGMLDMYYEINKYTCLISLLYAALTLQIPYIFTFFIEHPQLRSDMLIFSILSAIGQLAIYQMIKLFKQHVVPFVIATRKCTTVIVNIFHFKHQVNQKQLGGMLLVFAAILLQVFLNSKEKDKEITIKGDKVPSIEQQRLRQQEEIQEQTSADMNLEEHQEQQDS